jgi:hypothetical protein
MGIINMPTTWTLSAIETAIFVAVVLAFAVAGAWASAVG